MDHLIFRFAASTDAENIAMLHANSWKDTYRGIYTDQYLDNEVVIERLQTWKKRFETPQEQEIILAEDEGKLIGFACFYIDNDPSFGTLVDNLHVSKKYQGKGIGRMLLQKIIEYLKTNNISEKMYLWVLKDNISAIKFYQNICGRNVEKQSHLCPDGNYYDCFRMVWDSSNNQSLGFSQ